MAKSSLPIIMSALNARSGVIEDICLAEQMWAVYYNNQNISIRTKNRNTGLVKYKKTTFASIGHAERLAHRLNNQFKTQAFRVVEISSATRSQ
jgi:hypothetical protein